MKIFYHAGTTSHPYRSIMAEQQDIVIDGFTIPVSRLVIADQTHSNIVHICSESDAGAGIDEHPQIPIADGLISNIPNLWLMVRTADCTPILLWDESLGVVCALHSGREGTRKNITKAAIDIFMGKYASDPGNIKAIIGAGISKEHYEVSQAVCDEFYHSMALYGLDLKPYKDRHIDIRSAINAQMIALGLNPHNISNITDCTFENKSYFSYRRTGTNNRQINIIGVCHAKNL